MHMFCSSVKSLSEQSSATIGFKTLNACERRPHVEGPFMIYIVTQIFSIESFQFIVPRNGQPERRGKAVFMILFFIR